MVAPEVTWKATKGTTGQILNILSQMGPAMAIGFSKFNATVPVVAPIVLPMALIIVGEALLFVGNREDCLIVHVLNILICIMVPILLKRDSLVWQAFMLLSMLRVLSLAMPRFTEMTLYWMLMTYVPLIIVGYLLVRDDKMKFRDRLRNFKQSFTLSKLSGWKALYFPAGIILALVLANIEFEILSMNMSDLRLVPDLSAGSLALLFIVMVFFVGLGEELVFRYILQTRLEGSVGVIGAILITSLAFAIMHAGYESYIYIVYVFCISLILGVLYHHTKSLALVTLIHGCLNFFLFSLLPFGYLTLF